EQYASYTASRTWPDAIRYAGQDAQQLSDDYEEGEYFWAHVVATYPRHPYAELACRLHSAASDAAYKLAVAETEADQLQAGLVLENAAQALIAFSRFTHIDEDHAAADEPAVA